MMSNDELALLTRIADALAENGENSETRSAPVAAVLVDIWSALDRLVTAAERIAASHERFTRVMELANDVDLDAETSGAATADVQQAGATKTGACAVCGRTDPHEDDRHSFHMPDPHAPWTDAEEEAYAVIETLEEAGVRVPPDAYKRLGLDPPEREDEPTMDELEAPQPGTPGVGDDEPVTARRE